MMTKYFFQSFQKFWERERESECKSACECECVRACVSECVCVRSMSAIEQSLKHDSLKRGSQFTGSIVLGHTRTHPHTDGIWRRPFKGGDTILHLILNAIQQN